MAIQIIKRRNYSAPLPCDFYRLKSLTRLDTEEQLLYKQFPEPSEHYREVFTIGKDHLFFSGYWSKNMLVRWYQKAMDYLFPIKYKIEYWSINDHDWIESIEKQ